MSHAFKVKYLRIVIFVVLMLIIGLWGGHWAFYEGYVRLNYPSLKQFPIQGIDISHHQNNIDWQQLNKEQVQFVFIKATEGGDFKDPNFQFYVQSANRYNIPVGAYHFFTFCRQGKMQAENFIREVPKEVLSLPPVVDLEFGGNCKLAMTNEQLINEIDQYIQTIEKHYQRKVIIYATQEFYQSYLTTQFLNNPIWIRDIYKQPTLENNRLWLFWQYANRGKLNGIDGFVDLNVFTGSKAEFNSFLNESKAPVTSPDF